MDNSEHEKTSRVYSFILLVFLLLVRIIQSFTNVAYDVFVNNENKLVDLSQLENMSLILYGILMFGGFPLIASVLIVNKERLYKMNVDKGFPYLLLLAGLLGLYFIPYNCFSVVALAYYLYTLFAQPPKYSQIDKETLKKILFVMSCAIVLFFGGVLDSGKTFSLLSDIIPIAIYEEVIFRGLLFMMLNEIRIDPRVVFITQVVLFWVSHINYLIQAPFIFWIYIPSVGILLGYIVVKWKSLTLSTLVHLALNALTYNLT